MTQLVVAMGIGSPSIYAAFGSKEDLFREAVELYVSSEVEPAWRALEQVADARLAVREMFIGSIDAIAAPGSTRGCLVMLGAGLLGGADESVRAFLREQRSLFRDRLVKRLSRGVEEGDIHPDSDLETLADCILSFSGGLAIKAVDGATKAALRQSAELFCRQIFTN